MRKITRLMKERAGRLVGPSFPTLPLVTLWFGLCAGLCGVVGTTILGDAGFADELGLQVRIVLSLVLSGALASWIFHRPIRRAVREGRLFLASCLGFWVALLAVELGATLTVLTLSGKDEVPLGLALFFAPIFSLPFLVTAGPLSGMGLIWLGQRLGLLERIFPADEARDSRGKVDSQPSRPSA